MQFGENDCGSLLDFNSPLSTLLLLQAKAFRWWQYHNSLLPGLLSPVPDGCLATLVSFVLFCQKVFLYCTIRIFVFMFMDDLKCSSYVCVRVQQILWGSIKSLSNNYETLKPYLVKLQAIMPPPHHKGTSESWRKAQRTQRMCRA